MNDNEWENMPGRYWCRRYFNGNRSKILHYRKSQLSVLNSLDSNPIYTHQMTKQRSERHEYDLIKFVLPVHTDREDMTEFFWMYIKLDSSNAK